MTFMESFLHLSFPLGRWWGTRVRVSFLLPLVLAALFWRLQSLPLAIIAWSLLTVGIVLHELVSLFVARRTGGGSGMIIFWPLGSLTSVESGRSGRSEWLTVLAGPFLLLLIVAAFIWPARHFGAFPDVMEPFASLQPKGVTSASAWGPAVLKLTLWMHGMLLLANLLPVLPLDGGRVLTLLLSRRRTPDEVTRVQTLVGLIIALMLMMTGFVFDSSAVVLFSAILLMLHLSRITSPIVSEPPEQEDSFMGYDFSAGYTSLERSSADFSGGEDDDNQTREEELRRQREQERLALEARVIDEILDKLHRFGREALTPSELRTLNQASERYRERPHNES